MATRKAAVKKSDRQGPNAKQVRARYLKVRDKFLESDGVLGVGFGGIERDGKYTGELGIVVLVDQKLPPDKVSKGQLLPKAASGVRVDVREPRYTQQQHEEFAARNGLSEQQTECNLDHFWLDAGKLHAANLRRLMAEKRRANGPEANAGEPRDPSTAVHGEIFVIEDDGTIVDSGAGSIDHIQAYDIFRAEFGDDYDFVFFHYDTASGVPGQGNSSPTIYNQISGINHYKGDSYNSRSDWNSSKIQSVQKITGLSQVRRCLHETAHRWCSYVYHQEGGVHSENLHEEFGSASQKPYHWGSWFDSQESCMDYDYYDWQDSSAVAGEFEQDSLTSGAPGTDEFGFHKLDLYLMGLIDATEVGAFRYIQNPADPDGDGSFAGTPVTLTITNVTDEEGARNPAYPNTQRVFHQAFILITNNIGGIGSLADSTTVLGNFERYRQGLVDGFRREAGSRGMIDSSLLHAHYQDVYIRDNSADAGTSSSTGAFWDSPDIWVRNANDGGTDHEDTIRGQENWIHVRVHNQNMSDYDDVTVRVYRANFVGTEFFFPDDWQPIELVGEATLSVPGGDDETAVIQWNQAMIPDASWHPCLLVEVIPIEVTPEGRHHVWDNRKLAQKNITIVDPPSDTARIDWPFRFGHPSRKHDKFAVLTINRTPSLLDADLLLDTAGAELVLETRADLAPGREYLATPKFRPEIDPATRPGVGGVSIGFPRATEVIIGGGRCGDQGCMVLTICPGSRFVIRDTSSGVDTDELRPEIRNGRRLYRLPRREVVVLRVGTKGMGALAMRLMVEPGPNRAGLVRIMQSDTRGQVQGGADLELRG